MTTLEEIDELRLRLAAILREEEQIMKRLNVLIKQDDLQDLSLLWNPRPHMLND